MAAVALLGAGCGQAIHSQVSSYHQLPRAKQELSYAIIQLDEQRRDFDHMLYEQRVRAHLHAHGFVPEPLERADYIVAIAYESDHGEDTFAAYPIIGQSGSASFRLSGTTQAYSNTRSFAMAPTPARDAADADDGREPQTSVLRIDIVRRDSILRGRMQKVYEGEVLSSDGHGEFTAVVPAMIEALFQDFPGRDGEVRQVTSRSVPPIEEITAARQ